MTGAAIVAGALIVIAVLVVLGRDMVKVPNTRPSADRERDMSPRWARPRDVPKMVVQPGLSERAVLGELEGKRLAMESLESVMVLAPSGMGKTARYVVPVVLGWKGAAVITSVKGDAVALTIEHRRSQGPVWVVDPTGASGVATARWILLRNAQTYPAALKAAAWLADSSQVEKVTSNEQQLWATLGEQMIAPMLFAAARTGRRMEDVADWILFKREEEVAAILEDLGDRDAEAHWSSIRSAEGRTKSSIFITAQRIMHVFTHPLVRDALAPDGAGEEFSPDKLLDSGGTLYVVAPAEDQELFTPIFETLINAVVRAVEGRSASNGGLPISPRLLLMLEEAANCAPLRRLSTIASAGRGQGMQLVSVWQDEGQIETVFGSAKAGTVKYNHACQLILPGVKDDKTLQRMSDLIGPDHFRRESLNDSGRSRSATTSWVSEPLAPPHYIRELDDGLALAVVKNYKPMRIHTVAWYEDDQLRAQVGSAAAAFDAAFATSTSTTKAARRSRRVAKSAQVERGPLSGRSR